MQAQALETPTGEKKPSAPFEGIKKELLASKVRLCPKRASLIIDDFKHHADKKDSVMNQPDMNFSASLVFSLRHP